MNNSRRTFFTALSSLPFLAVLGKAQTPPQEEANAQLNRKVFEAAMAWASPFVLGTDEQRTQATLDLLTAVNARKMKEAY